MEEGIGKLLTIFEEISAIPRCSKHEEKISQWLIDWAKDHDLEYETDEFMNVVIRVAGTTGYENSPSVVLQGHIDMVCEKLSSSDHNFDTDAIKLVRDGEWLHAENTTLGADNGVAVVMGLAVISEGIAHPPLELLFTADEETGLTGAANLKSDFLKSSLFINLDSEGEGKFTIGCAGGKDVTVSLALQPETAPAESEFLAITAGGMKGGHSGVDIDKNRACANKVMARLLYNLKEEFSFNLVEIKGGFAHNAISRDARAVICSFPEDREAILTTIGKLKADLVNEYKDLEPEISLQLEELSIKGEVFSEESTGRAIDLLLALPHGIAAMTPKIPELVETSDNMATMEIKENSLEILLSIRSSVGSRLEALNNTITAIGTLSGADVSYSDGYPAWQPDVNSILLKKSMQIYDELFGEKAEVLIIHAGLECGVIGEKYPEMEMISFGPTIVNAHSPEEKLHLPSFYRTWQFLVKLLSELK